MAEIKEKTFKFLGLRFHAYPIQECLEKLEEFIAQKTPRMVFTPTAELIVRANESKDLKEIYNRTDLLTVDSFVVYYAAKLFSKPIKESVSAARLMFSFLEVAHKKNYRLYLLGATEEVVSKTVENIRRKYPGINIVGWHNGYFGFDSHEDIVQDIIQKKPDVLFVAMSSPFKEKFISKNLERMDVPVCIGVGGSFDIIAGKCRLAPAWISKMGLEWFYRLIQEPKRLWKRYLITNIKFLWLVVKEFFRECGGSYGRVQKIL